MKRLVCNADTWQKYEEYVPTKVRLWISNRRAALALRLCLVRLSHGGADALRQIAPHDRCARPHVGGNR